MENRATDSQEIDLLELAKSIWLEKTKIIKWGCIGLATGIVIAFSIPNQYRSVVRIASESNNSGLSMGSMGGLAAMAGIDLGGKGGSEGISEKVYPEIVKSTPFLLEFANMKVDNDGEIISFYEYVTKEQKSPWWSYVISAPIKAIGWVRSIGADDKKDDQALNIFKPSQTQNAYIGFLNQHISIVTDKKSNIIDINVTMQDPIIAAVVADSVMTKLQRYMTEYRTSKTRADLAMNEKMLAEAKQKYYDAEAAYAAAQDRNQNMISKSAQVKLERLTNEKSLAFTIYQQLATQVELNRVKLQENTPIATIIEPASVPIRAESPNKKIIAIAFAFLGCFAAIGIVVVKQLLNPNKAD